MMQFIKQAAIIIALSRAVMAHDIEPGPTDEWDINANCDGFNGPYRYWIKPLNAKCAWFAVHTFDATINGNPATSVCCAYRNGGSSCVVNNHANGVIRNLADCLDGIALPCATVKRVGTKDHIQGDQYWGQDGC